MSDRIKKKDLKKPDQLQTTTMKLMEYARENKSKIIAGSAAVVLAVFLVSGWYVYAAYNEKQAQDLFGKSMLMPIGNAATQEGVARLALEKRRMPSAGFPPSAGAEPR